MADLLSIGQNEKEESKMEVEEGEEEVEEMEEEGAVSPEFELYCKKFFKDENEELEKLSLREIARRNKEIVETVKADDTLSKEQKNEVLAECRKAYSIIRERRLGGGDKKKKKAAPKKKKAPMKKKITKSSKVEVESESSTIQQLSAQFGRLLIALSQVSSSSEQ